MIKVGLLGFGFMGSMHFNVYRQMPDVHVAGIFDLDPERVRRGETTAGNIGDAGEMPDLEGVNVTDDAGELIGSADIDVIDICLPTCMHAGYAEKALGAGKHVFCEKPMALGPADCDRMLKARDRAGKELMIGHCIRFWPEYMHAARMIEEKTYGEVICAFFRRLSETPTWSCRNWILDGEKSGGALLDLHIHDIDYIISVFGRVREVHSFGKENIAGPQSGVDYMLTRYVTEGGALVAAEGGWHLDASSPFNMSFHIKCEGATLMFDSGWEKTLAVYTEDGRTDYPQHAASTGWAEELKYFTSCVQSGRSVDLCPPEESKAAVETALSELRSIRENRPVATL